MTAEKMEGRDVPGLAAEPHAGDARPPRDVTRGESDGSDGFMGHGSASIDWLNCTLPFKDVKPTLLLQLERSLGLPIGASRRVGFFGYTYSSEIGIGMGRFAYGGGSQKGTCLLSLNGQGCQGVSNWPAVHQLITEMEGKITRVDLAHDDYQGVYDIKAGLMMMASGGFTSAGRPPNFKYLDDFGSNTGKTLYVGSRKNGKLLRIYEKGKQLGDPISPWVRWELELHARDRLIPADILLRPAEYLAGSYPCLQWISESPQRIETLRKKLEIGFSVLLRSCKQSYGKLLWVMHEHMGYEAKDILEELIVEGVPPRLRLPPSFVIQAPKGPDIENS